MHRLGVFFFCRLWAKIFLCTIRVAEYIKCVNFKHIKGLIHLKKF